MAIKTNQQQTGRNNEIINLSEKGTPLDIVEVLLKNPGQWFAHVTLGRVNRCVLMFFLISTTCYMGYSIIVGSFAGNDQWLFAPAKIISGTIVSILLCYPSLYIFACLSGANIDLEKTMALLASGMTLCAILLIGFAPVSFVFTFAIKSEFFMGMIHLFVWGISMYFGIRHISNGLQHMSCDNTRLIRIWGVILMITMLQMTVTLRPILGESNQFLTSEKRFFVEHWLENIPSEDS